jgi:hypothetical protein
MYSSERSLPRARFIHAPASCIWRGVGGWPWFGPPSYAPGSMHQRRAPSAVVSDVVSFASVRRRSAAPQMPLTCAAVPRRMAADMECLPKGAIRRQKLWHRSAYRAIPVPKRGVGQLRLC